MQGKKIDINSDEYENELKKRITNKTFINQNGCWEWTGCTKEGNYGVIRAKRKNYLAHRLAFELFKKQKIEGFFVCHKCDNPCCCNPDHMFLGNQTENMVDAKNKNRMKKGEGHYNKKLLEKDVVEIKKLLRVGFGTRKIGKLYGVSQSCISKISLKSTWKSIKA